MRPMLEAFAWGLLAASSLLLGAAAALRFRVGLHTIGLIMAFGAGVLISALAFDLIEEAVNKATGHGAVLIGVFAGCGVFFGGDLLIDRAGGDRRKSASGGHEDDSALAIVLGTVLDGIPESIVIGLTIYQGGAVGAAYLSPARHAKALALACWNSSSLMTPLFRRSTSWAISSAAPLTFAFWTYWLIGGYWS
jgi:ZIP family zinc transporter